MRVIGTAGHVDHGKSTLVEALTGIHPDRLKEEREREMTIDLGFAWTTLPNGEEIGIIDVPGHRDFIENMLSGVGGIDAALFVIAADEGVMPQTREHLAILDLLQIQGGVIALTKVDMVTDPEWIDLIEEDIRQAVSGTVLENAPIIRVSGRYKTGIPALLDALSQCLADRPLRGNLGRPRLPVDRVFTISGFGTVVTGTLIDGSLKVGDEIEILPQKNRGRVRGLQTHKRKEELAVPGSRTAVNITGLNVDQIQRGDVVVHPKDYQATSRFDARLRLLNDASSALRHNIQLKLFVGSAEVVARLRLLGREELKPGDVGWVQYEVNKPVVVVRGDRYIIRRPSPGETLGGGIILDAHPRGRHKRYSKQILERLESLEKGTPADVFMHELTVSGVASLRDISSRINIGKEETNNAIADLLATGQLVCLDDRIADKADSTMDTLVTTRGYWEQISTEAIAEIKDYHHTYSLRRGMPKEELKSRLKLSSRIFNGVMLKLTNYGVIVETGPLVRLPDHSIVFSAQQKKAVDNLMARFKTAPFSPPSVKECLLEVGEDVYQALVERNDLIQLTSDVVFSKDGYEQMLSEVKRLLNAQGTITAAQVRDHFNTSRRYVLAFLEYLDTQGITVREGDVRRLHH